ncbi:hypothetical protein BJY52DRAFT_1122446 [Lactarius psammicola]|nr:hypothetical protein BJY52DRAFT_1122446 [Lactarius psammicola]
MSPPINSNFKTSVSTTPLPPREGTDIESPCINFSAPQCCHCGWRGTHSPTCPFGSGRH